MAKDVNLLTISGNLTADPELRFTRNDTPVANFRIASNRPFRNGDDEWDEETTFVGVTAWQNLAERVDEAFTKGDRVLITGRLDLNQYETDDGDERSYLFITAENVQPMGRWGDFLDSEEEEKPKKKRKSNGRSSKKGSRRPKRSRNDDMDVDDIPF